MKLLQKRAAAHSSPVQAQQTSGQGASLPAVYARASQFKHPGTPPSYKARYVIQPKQGSVHPALQLKQASDGIKGSPVSGGVIQLAKWEWSEAKQQWKLLSGSAKSVPPSRKGEFDRDIEEDEDEDRKDGTFGGKRIIGDSSALAKNRYDLGVKPESFKPWKKNREAQHIIPACLAKIYPALVNIIDEAENGIMLPAVHDSANDKVTHRKPTNRDHPTYTNNVNALIKNVLKCTTLKSNQVTMSLIMKALRRVNKLIKYEYIDDIPYNEFARCWNKEHPAYLVPLKP